jgi:outer membrane protein insertion porin family
VFEPARPEPAVAEVKFTGNQAIPSTVLMNSFAGVAFGTIYRESSFRQMLDASIRPLYDARGRVQVAFPRIATEPSKTVDGLVVTVTVDEGPTFDLGKVEIGGEPPLPAKSLLDAAKFKSGEIANFDEVNASLDRMKRLLQREGYQQPELKVERKLNEREKVVDLLVRIEPGGRYTFGKLTIEGLDINGEAAVRKLWSMQEGKPFNANYPEYFLEQIRERGIFDDLGDTKPVVQLNEEARTADVTLIFRASKGSGETDPVTGRRRRR